MPDRPVSDISNEVRSLKRQVRWLQAGLLGMSALGVMAAVAAPEIQGVIRAKGLVIVDDQGRDRILIGAPIPKVEGRLKSPTTSIVFRQPDGADRLIVGEAPDPQLDGKIYPRVGVGWGVALFNPKGDERGGMAYLDNGRAIVSLDRPWGDAVSMFVNEKSGFAGITMNYGPKKFPEYAEALRIGTKGDQAYIQATNRDGSPAGALIGGAGGRPHLAEKAE